LTLSSPAGVPAPAISESTPDPGGLPVNPDAETVPWRTEEMKARIRAALEKRVAAVDVPPPVKPADPAPKSPRDAATLPTDQPAKEIATGSTPPAPPMPEPLPAVPAMPKLNYVSEPASGQVQNANPLKDFLQTVDRLELLKRHVDPGSDQEKLKSEVEKTDTVAIAMSVDSFADVDTLRDLQALPVPCVTVFGATDTFLPAPDTRMISNLTEGRSIFHAIPMDGTRHFPMLENIAGFTRLVLDFLEAPDVTKLTIKETWERRVR
jgi:pimeloyl-ACP methyl ester carboxylesterase